MRSETSRHPEEALVRAVPSHINAVEGWKKGENKGQGRGQGIHRKRNVGRCGGKNMWAWLRREKTGQLFSPFSHNYSGHF